MYSYRFPIEFEAYHSASLPCTPEGRLAPAGSRPERGHRDDVQPTHKIPEAQRSGSAVQVSGISPPSGGEKHSPVDGCDRGVFFVLLNHDPRGHGYS